jgi:hypothetical protein
MLSKVYYRPISGHPVFMNVNMFYRKVDPNRTKQYLTLPFQKARTDMMHVLVTTTNEHVTKFLRDEYMCEVEQQPITVAKHLAEVTRIDLVNIQTFSCDRHTCEIEWELYYYVPPGVPIQTMRNMMQSGGGDNSV